MIQHDDISLTIKTNVSPARMGIKDFTLDQPMIYVALKDPHDHENLAGASAYRKEGTQTPLLRNHHGLSAAYSLALQTVTSDHAATKLAESFAGLETKTSEPITKQTIQSMFQCGTQILLVPGLSENVRGFHVPPGELTVEFELPINHIFLNEDDVRSLLPIVPKSDWTQEHRNGIFAQSWWLVHELSHLVASLLFVKGKISDVKTPTKYVPWKVPQFGKCELTVDGDLIPKTGERGFWLESQLGGLVEALPSVDGPGAEIVYMKVTALLKRRWVESIVVNDFLNGKIQRILFEGEGEDCISYANAMRLKNRTCFIMDIPHRPQGHFKY